MGIIGNILWFFLGGAIVCLIYFVIGLVMCCTIIGIPFGVQLWKLGLLALCPFDREVESNPGSGCLPTVFNILWIVTGWWEIALVHLFFGIICAITIIGIPFAKQHFKMMKMSLLPFGSTII